MKKFQAGKMPRQNHLRRTLLIAGLLVIVAILTKAVWDIYFKNQLAENNLAGTVKELVNLEARKAKLASEVDKLKTDQGLDENIRNNFSVAKEGEKVITIVNDEACSTVATTTPNRSWWARMWGKI